ncbi:hypothetical protein BCR44DRAFT_64543 [Catenaria anguillulae PL171]|uniref:DUF659 domain-containing protein n=1 Tax=Catenaria anguillulae PL171 TaxID=765915 RepID=A0A1Y2H962_9FUNG|nr:hypothetical protein BCR44DRAFT_64543 [Catenaria anguillulae PL171]
MTYWSTMSLPRCCGAGPASSAPALCRPTSHCGRHDEARQFAIEGLDKLVADVTDSASNYKSARNKLDTMYPRLLGLPCLNHWTHLSVCDSVRQHPALVDQGVHCLVFENHQLSPKTPWTNHVPALARFR